MLDLLQIHIREDQRNRTPGLVVQIPHELDRTADPVFPQKMTGFVNNDHIPVGDPVKYHLAQIAGGSAETHPHAFRQHPDQLSATAAGCGTQKFRSAVVVLLRPVFRRISFAPSGCAGNIHHCLLIPCIIQRMQDPFCHHRPDQRSALADRLFQRGDRIIDFAAIAAGQAEPTQQYILGGATLQPGFPGKQGKVLPQGNIIPPCPFGQFLLPGIAQSFQSALVHIIPKFSAGSFFVNHRLLLLCCSVLR